MLYDEEGMKKIRTKKRKNAKQNNKKIEIKQQEN